LLLLLLLLIALNFLSNFASFNWLVVIDAEAEPHVHSRINKNIKIIKYIGIDFGISGEAKALCPDGVILCFSIFLVCLWFFFGAKRLNSFQNG